MKLRFIFKLIILSFQLLILPFYLSSQIKSEAITLDKHEEVIEIIYAGKNGLLVETVNTDTYKFELRHYTSTLDLDWDTPLNLSSPNFKTSASNLTDYVYLTNQTLQLDLKNRSIRTFDISTLPPGRVFRAYFQDYKYWYGLYYVKFNDTYMMRRVNHSNCSLKDIIFQLPKGPQYLYSTEWYYLNNDNNNNIYVYNKTAGFQHMGHYQNNKFNYEIINLDTSMTVRNRVNINVNLDSIYVCPSLNFKREHELPSPGTDFELKTIGIKDIWTPKPEAYSSIIFDPLKKGYYIYGLWSYSPFFETKNKSKAKGFFIFRYDNKGKLMNKTISRLPNDTAIYAGFDARTLFSFTPDNKFIFQIYFDKIINKLKVRGNVYTYIYYDDKLFSQYTNTIQSDLKKNTNPLTYDFVAENLQHFDFILTSSNFSGSAKFYNALNPKDQRTNIYRIYWFENGNILTEEDVTKNEINLFLFNK